MNKTFKIILWIAALILLCGAAFWIYSVLTAAPSSVTASSTPIGLPVAGSASSDTSVPQGSPGSTVTSGMMTLPAAGNGSIAVNDFLDNGITVPDPSNAGQYYLAGPLDYCAPGTNCNIASTTDFTIVYFANSHFFNIGLNREPLGQVRAEAEQFLESTLGIGASQLCNLQYYVGTSISVNDLYSGKNLGFDGCYQATDLP